MYQPLLRAYFASSMTGRSGKELVSQSREIEFLCGRYQIEALDPIVSEKVQADNKPLNNGGDLLRDYWARDKEMIKSAHVLIDVTGAAKSEGVSHEIGLARYFLYKPVIRVYPNLSSSIARLEDDLIVEDIEEAIKLALAGWGTPWKRLKWRMKIYHRCLPGMLKAFFREWRNCIW